MRRDAFVCVFHRSRRRRMDQRWRIGDRVEARYRAGTTPAVLLPTGEDLLLYLATSRSRRAHGRELHQLVQRRGIHLDVLPQLVRPARVVRSEHLQDAQARLLTRCMPPDLHWHAFPPQHRSPWVGAVAARLVVGHAGQLAVGEAHLTQLPLHQEPNVDDR